MPHLRERVRSLSAILSSDGWTRERLRDFQSRRLRTLVRHAYDRVPMYRELYRRNRIHPNDVRGIEDLARLPIVNREDIQACPTSEVVAAGFNPGRLVIRRTGGSTGVPLEIRRTWFEERLLHAARLRRLRIYGLRLKDLRVSVTTGNTPPSGHRFDNRHLARLGFLRLAHVSCLLPAREILNQLAEVRPDLLGGYPSVLCWIAGEATEADRQAIRPRLMFCGGETLTPEMRRQITECFSAPLHEIYGAHEFNLVGYECCETGLLHAAENCTIVEVVKDGKVAAAGETGELVGTALHSFAMPFIRYRLGDLVTRGPIECACGAPATTIEKVVGRTLDRFPLPDGSEIYSYRLIVPITRGARWVRRFQIVQTEIDRIEIKLIPFPGQLPGAGALDAIREQIEGVAGPGVAADVTLVDDLPPADNGKFRACYSMVARRGK